MAQATWEKGQEAGRVSPPKSLSKKGERAKFLIGGVLIIGAIVYLMVSGTLTGARFFITVEEVVGDSGYLGETVRISGAVIGETINYTVNDDDTTNLTFTISHIPEEFDNLAEALHLSVNDPDATHLVVHMENEAMPDLLQHEAQAIITGSMQPDGTFFATELLLKCPSRFDEGGSDQSLGNDHPEVPLDDAS